MHLAVDVEDISKVLVKLEERCREFVLLFQHHSSENANSDRHSPVLTFLNHSRWTVFCLKAWTE